MLLFLFACLLLAPAIKAQQSKGTLEIQINKNTIQPGDSLFVTVTYQDGENKNTKQPLATMELIVENEQGQRTRLRWPVIDGQASGAIYLPDSLPRGRYTLFAGLQQRFFEVVGKVKNGAKAGTIQAMLLTKDGAWDQQEVSVAQDGSFAIRNWLFEDNALMAFSATRNNKYPLDITISTQLDSSNTPLAVAGRVFYVGNPPATVGTNLNQPVAAPESAFADRGSVLPAVVVRAVAKTPAQQFDEAHVSGLFRSGDERLVSIMEDPAAFGFPNLFTYLQGRVAGLQVTPNGPGGGSARWRGNPVVFFLDEMRVAASQIANIPMADIAIVKAFPPPFFGATGGGGAIAVYTRRGGEASFLPAGRQVFRVRGFTPSATALNMGRLAM